MVYRVLQQIYPIIMFHLAYKFISIVLFSLTILEDNIFRKWDQYKGQSILRNSKSYQLISLEDFSRSFLYLCFLGYLCFWLFNLNQLVGFVFIFSFVILVFKEYRSNKFHRKNSDQVKEFLNSIFWLALMFLSIVLLYQKYPSLPGYVSERFFDLPGDNVLPLKTAEILWNAKSTVDLGDGWKIGDRPPLQAGMTLMMLGPLSGAYALALNILFQMISLIGLILFLRNFNFLKSISKQMYLILLTPWCYINTVFTWPKMLSAGLFFCFLFYLQKLIKHNRWKDSILSGLSISLSTLSHAGVLLSIAFLIFYRPLFLIRKRTKKFAVMCFLFVVIMLTWKIYVSKYSPPGDRLLKFNLAGMYDSNNDEPLMDLIKNAYKDLTLHEFIRHKLKRVVDFLSNQSGVGFFEYRRLHMFHFFTAFAGVLLFSILIGVKKIIKYRVTVFQGVIVILVSIFLTSFILFEALFLHASAYPPFLLIPAFFSFVLVSINSIYLKNLFFKLYLLIFLLLFIPVNQRWDQLPEMLRISTYNIYSLVILMLCLFNLNKIWNLNEL